MIRLYKKGAWLVHGTELMEDGPQVISWLREKTCKEAPDKEDAAKNTIAYGILEKHNTSGDMDDLKIKFDKLTSHDIHL